MSLDAYLVEARTQEIVPRRERPIEQEKLSLQFKTEDATEFSEAFLVSSSYDGESKTALLKFYEPVSHKVLSLHDRSGHQPYCFSDLSTEELSGIGQLISHPGLDRFEKITKYDLLRDTPAQFTKIVAKDPLAIGGRPSGCIRDIIPQNSKGKIWEADIPYRDCYIYDEQLALGMPYQLSDGKLSPKPYKLMQQEEEAISKIFENESQELKDHADRWIPLLQSPTTELRRVALDIEVATEIPTRLPDANEAKQQVLCVSLLGSDGTRRVLLLERPGVEFGDVRLPQGVSIERYEDEVRLFIEIFKALLDYPFVITFNGDNFDLRYIFHRAENYLGFSRAQIPIELGKESATLKYGVHIDLYKFFFNRSIQIYAFGQRYKENTLDSVGEALIGVQKLKMDNLLKASYSELAAYCYRDAQITLELTRFDDSLVVRLVTILSRIARMPFEDTSRQGVSRWIRSLVYSEHRRIGAIIPRSEDILATKGVTATEAIIKGKKYKGAIVVQPKPGVYFNVSVLDFASLYPSIIKKHNLSYETILCPHQECRSNIVPDTPHWVCTKKRGLSSLIIGSLRDLRVKWYKSKAKDKTLLHVTRSWYNVVNQALKVILNASYGVFGSEIFSLYCPPVAEATTAIGRYAITETIKEAERLGIEVVYGDTDSIFLRSPRPDQIERLTEWTAKQLGMELDVDKLYRYAALSSRKKNYLGVFPDGSVDIKGLTGKKRNTPEFLKKAFEDMVKTLSGVQTEEDFGRARQRIKEIVRTCYVKLKNKEYTLEDLAFNVMLGKSPDRYTKTTPQHLKAATQLSSAGLEVVEGDLISYVKVYGSPGVKPLQLASINEVDTDKYMDYVESTFDQVLDALGLEFNEILGIVRLESFFGITVPTRKPVEREFEEEEEVEETG